MTGRQLSRELNFNGSDVSVGDCERYRMVLEATQIPRLRSQYTWQDLSITLNGEFDLVTTINRP